MIDAGLVGGGWIRLQKGHYRHAQPQQQNQAGAATEFNGVEGAQLVLEADWDATRPPLVGAGSGVEWQRLCPLRTLSYDLLHSGGVRQLHQPEPNSTELLGISFVLDSTHGDAADSGSFAMAILVQPVHAGRSRAVSVPVAFDEDSSSGGSAGPVTQTVQTIFVRSEAELLRMFEQQLVLADPDFITGTDVGHSMQLMNDRAEILGLLHWGAGACISHPPQQPLSAAV